jgi:hypothetical protein
MKKMTKLSWILSFFILGFWGNANALTSTGVDGALFVNSATTINLTDNQVFNFTTIDITQGGILSFSGLSSNQTFSVLASGNINIAGIINLTSNAIFETPNSFNLDGNIYIPNNSVLTLNANSATINGTVIFTNPVPEPSSYALLLAGGLFLTLTKRKART